MDIRICDCGNARASYLQCVVRFSSQLVRQEPPHSIEAGGSVVMMLYSAKADKHAQCSVINDLHTDVIKQLATVGSALRVL